MKLATHNLAIHIGDKSICTDLNITIAAQEIWGILGPNGSGKTTLLHTLAGLHVPTQGQIHLIDKNIRTLSPKKISQQLGVLFQEMHLAFAQTVWDFCLAARYPHLGYFKKKSHADEEIVTEVLIQMELLTYKERSINKLSGGEKRRLAIASLLVQNPQIYLLDEPTNHLDLRHQVSTLKHFYQLATSAAKAVMMSLHDVNLAQQFCSHILLLFADGSHLHGNCETILTAENISALYQHPVKKISAGKNIFWQL